MNKKNRRAGIKVVGPGSVDNPPEDLRPPTRGARDLEEFNDSTDTAEEIKINQILEMEGVIGGTIYLQRRALHDTEYRRIGRVAAKDFTLDLIQQTYGGGDYKAQVHTSKNKFVTSFPFGIDLMIPPKHPLQRPEQTPATDANSLIKTLQAAGLVGKQGDGEQGMIAIVMANMQAQNEAAQRSSERQFQMMMQMMQQNQSSPRDPIITILLEKALNQKTTPVKELMESMQLVKKFQSGDLSSDDDEPKTGLDKVFDGIGKIAGPIVEHLANKHLGNGEADTRALPTLANGTAQPAAVRQPQPTKTAQPPMFENMMLQQFRAKAIAAAKKGRDAFEFVQMAFDMVPEQYHVKVFKQANDQNWFAGIFGDDEEARQHLKFLTQVRECVLILAFRGYAQRASTSPEGITPEAFVGGFLKWASPDFHDSLAAFCEDKESFADVFGDLAANPWFAQLPDLVEKLLAGGGEDPDTDDTPEGQPAKEAAKPAAAARPAAPKTTQRRK